VISITLHRTSKKRKKQWKNILGPLTGSTTPVQQTRLRHLSRSCRDLPGRFPLHFDFRRFIAEGDLVVVHSHLVREPQDRGMAVMDIFRIENKKIVEHWDVLQEIPESPANNNTMF
jgi:hypothetical protein